jgi:hypothetical protein
MVEERMKEQTGIIITDSTTCFKPCFMQKLTEASQCDLG